MEIEYLKFLQIPDVAQFENQPLYPSEIETLEQEFNHGESFPKVLKELLYLAGKYCYLLTFNSKSQSQMQHYAIKELQKENLTIKHRFYVIDLGNDDFSYISLEENNEDPILYCVYFGDSDDRGNLFSLNITLSKYLSNGFEKIKNGYTPF